MNKKGQINPRDIISVITILLVLGFFVPAISLIFSPFSPTSLDNIINSFIPIFILALILEFARRFF